MRFKKVYEDSHKRYYKASEPIRFVKRPWSDTPEPTASLLEGMKSCKKLEYRYIFDDYNFDIVCVSDAKTHSERLVFFGVQTDLEDLPYVTASYDSIGGEHTMMMHGGDQETLRDDAVYLRRIAMINTSAQKEAA